MRDLHVLIADDDSISLDLVANTLSDLGYTAETVDNGRDAWDLLKTGRFAIALLDWEMPELSGVDVCRLVRGKQWPAYIYLFLVTGHTKSEEIVAGIDAGADDYVTKPFNPLELRVRVRAAVRLLELEHRLLERVDQMKLSLEQLARVAESSRDKAKRRAASAPDESKFLCPCDRRDVDSFLASLESNMAAG